MGDVAYGFRGTAYGGNIFTAAGDDDVQQIRAVAVDIYDALTNYEISVYKGVGSVPNRDERGKVLSTVSRM